jgi:hypothetical protein
VKTKKTTRGQSLKRKPRLPALRTVLIYLDNHGMPMAFPNPARVGRRWRIVFESVERKPFHLAFEESPARSGHRNFSSSNSNGMHRRSFEVRSKWRRAPYKYSITVGGRVTDPEIIIEPW